VLHKLNPSLRSSPVLPEKNVIETNTTTVFIAHAEHDIVLPILYVCLPLPDTFLTVWYGCHCKRNKSDNNQSFFLFNLRHDLFAVAITLIVSIATLVMNSVCRGFAAGRTRGTPQVAARLITVTRLSFAAVSIVDVACTALA